MVPFDIGVTGSISERHDDAIAVQDGVESVIVSRDGRTIYVGAPTHTDSNDNDVPGAIEAYAVAADGSLSLRQSVPAQASQLALTPDGSRLYVLGSSQILSFPVEADGSLGSVSPLAIGSGVMSFVIRPDGSTLYATVYPYFLEQWGIGADGSLTALLPTDLGACRSGFVGVTPDSRHLDVMCGDPNGGVGFSLGDGGALALNGARFAASAGRYVEDVRGRALYVGVSPHWIDQLQREPGGTLTGFPAGAIFDADYPVALAADPGGSRLVVSVWPNALKTFAIASDGSLALSPIAIVPTTAGSFSHLAFAPDQPPVAALSASGAAGSFDFDASGSHAVDGTIARYDWNFGDGTGLADAGPRPGHLYSSAGEYTATVTVTDSAGCSVAGTFNGAVSVCAGSPAAAARLTVHSAAAAAVAPTATPAPTAAASSPSGAGLRPSAARATANMRGDKVLLTWKQPEGSAAPTRYLLAWSTLHSAHGPGDRNMHHLYRTKAHILLRTKPGTTLHFAVYAQLADGTFTRATKTTLRLRR
jgi:hypothetical protein